VIESESYWLTCMRYVELNPVRAGIVRNSDDYRWSSGVRMYLAAMIHYSYFTNSICGWAGHQLIDSTRGAPSAEKRSLTLSWSK
jgi:hypothetical protein